MHREDAIRCPIGALEDAAPEAGASVGAVDPSDRGLKDNADILFILTTNRPEQLEDALAGRPGRIDQAVEVPLPDDLGREKLARLYGSELKLSDEIIGEAVARTKGVSAAFIKELMRRTAQSAVIRDGGKTVKFEDLAEALDDMLFSSGRLNVRLLGGADAVPTRHARNCE